MNTWEIFQGKQKPHNGISRLPEPPSWRKFGSTDVAHQERHRRKGETFQVRSEEIELVNAALYLRRPLLVTGKPGTGKTSLAYTIAHELKLGEVLKWSITTQSTLQEGLYSYDAIGRLQEIQREGKKDNIEDIGKYIQLGALGTALFSSDKPRVLLIDEIDKSDIDLPNNLLNIFEEGEFQIPELSRIAKQCLNIEVQTEDRQTVTINRGWIRCQAFPCVILTSNGERDFPPAFLRRCLRLSMKEPSPEELTEIVKAHLGEEILPQVEFLIKEFVKKRGKGDLATDQLLNAIYLVTRSNFPTDDRDRCQDLAEKILQYLTTDA
ncbi:MAG: AAA family ATPase [Waterburya sp.]